MYVKQKHFTIIIEITTGTTTNQKNITFDAYIHIII